VATAVIYALLIEPAERTRANVTADIRLGTIVAFIVGMVFQFYAVMKNRLESQNVVLPGAVQTRTSQLNNRKRNWKLGHELWIGDAAEIRAAMVRKLGEHPFELSRVGSI